MKRLFIIVTALCALCIAQAPAPKQFTFDLILRSSNSGVLIRPEGPCKVIVVLVTKTHLPATPAIMHATFKGSDLYLDGSKVKLEEFVVLTAPGCSKPPKEYKAL